MIITGKIMAMVLLGAYAAYIVTTGIVFGMGGYILMTARYTDSAKLRSLMKILGMLMGISIGLGIILIMVRKLLCPIL